MPTRYRGLTYRGRTVSACEEPLFYHLVKRVVAEQQWAFGTTARQCLEDLRPAVRHHIRLGIYVRQGDSLGVTISRTFEVVPEDRLDTVPARRIIVVYSATRGVLVTGYQFSSYPDLRIPEGASWLK